MKIGIVTIFDNNNQGNRLQNYALQEMLGRYSGTVETIKNKPQRKSLKQRLMSASFLAESPCVNRMVGKRRKAEMLWFNKKHLKISRQSVCCEDAFRVLKEKCDMYCSGSDQIWNPAIGRANLFDFLGFADRERTFSYAASFGIDEIPEQYKEAVRKGLQHIKYISVREDAGKRIVEELTGRTDVEVLVDPTMLLTTNEWDKILRKPKAPLPEKYILTYFLGPVSPDRRSAIRKKADQMGCEVIEVMDENGPFYAIGPDQFVYLIKNAQMVCTDSFHGSVFSFLYQRRLAIFDREGEGNNMGSRIDTFTTKFHLEGCRVRGNDLPENIPEPDYSAGYKTLVDEREKSRRFLSKVFHKE